MQPGSPEIRNSNIHGIFRYFPTPDLSNFLKRFGPGRQRGRAGLCGVQGGLWVRGGGDP